MEDKASTNECGNHLLNQQEDGASDHNGNDYKLQNPAACPTSAFNNVYALKLWPSREAAQFKMTKDGTHGTTRAVRISKSRVPSNANKFYMDTQQQIHCPESHTYTDSLEG
jgi:hypothetical protein